MSAAMRTVDLYGGAMRVCLPSTMADASDFRQVPDNQEVYVDADTGASVIVELLSRQSAVTNDAAGTFFYRDLAKDNGCAPQSIVAETSSPLSPSAYPRLAASSGAAASQPCDYACVTTGLQSISKFTNEVGRENIVFVGLAVLRFTPPVSTEVLVSVSCPSQLHPDSSEARVVRRLLTPEERLHVLHTAVETLEVLNWGLFVAEDE